MNSFLDGKNTIKSLSLCVPSTLAATPYVSRPRAAPVPAGSNVEVIKEGDKVVRLVFTCSCGERTEVDCIYPAGA